MAVLRSVTLTARQPLSLGTRRNAGTAVLRSHRHIRGTVLRGALARVWIAAHGRPDELARAADPQLAVFVELFERHVRYGDLLPTGWSLVPLSVRRCKYRPEPACSRWYADEALRADADSGVEECEVCAGPAESSKGQLEFFGEPAGPLLRESTHVELTPEGVAAEGQLFTREAIRARDDNGRPTMFTGTVTLPDDLSSQAHSWLAAERSVRIGGRGSTSGLAVVSSSPAASPAPRTGHRLVLRFAAPVLLVDDSGLPRLRPDEADLSRLFGTDVTIERSWARHARVGGWNVATNLPKPEEQAVSAGSTYLLRCEQPPDPRRLVALRDAGLGLRRNEGYGAVRLDDEAWSPPAPTAPTGGGSGAAATTPASDAAQTARRLHETGHGPWLLDKLRETVRERAAGRPSDAGLLTATTLRDLRPTDREALERLLLDADAALLDEVVRHLNLLVRRA